MKYSSIPATSTVFYVTKSQVSGISAVCESDGIGHKTRTRRGDVVNPVCDVALMRNKTAIPCLDGQAKYLKTCPRVVI